MRLILFLLFAIWSVITGWIVAVQMRKRIKQSLHKKVSDVELVSLNTWMKVQDMEDRDAVNKPLHPK